MKRRGGNTEVCQQATCQIEFVNGTSLSAYRQISVGKEQDAVGTSDARPQRGIPRKAEYTADPTVIHFVDVLTTTKSRII